MAGVIERSVGSGTKVGAHAGGSERSLGWATAGCAPARAANKR